MAETPQRAKTSQPEKAPLDDASGGAVSSVTAEAAACVIRRADPADVAPIIEIDAHITGLAKPDYWQDLFARYGERSGRYVLVAEHQHVVVGFIIGEIRAWEFGSPPCGWVFAISVLPDVRLHKVGSQLFDQLCREMAQAGVDKVRTMLARDDRLNMSFFRSQGMMGGPFIQLEKPLD